jgi:hypothetical protein
VFDDKKFSVIAVIAVFAIKKTAEMIGDFEKGFIAKEFLLSPLSPCSP